MIKKPITILVLVALLGVSLTVPAMAQQRVSIKLSSELTTKWSLLRRKNVQEDLKLGPEKSKSIVKVLDDAMSDLRSFSPSGATSVEDIQDSINEHARTVEKKFIPKLTSEMTPEQLTRLSQVELQIGELPVLESKSVAEKLGFTSEQASQVKALLKKGDEEISESMMKNMEEMPNPENGRVIAKPNAKAGLERTRITKQYREKFLKLLTEDQTKVWATLVGDPIKPAGVQN